MSNDLNVPISPNEYDSLCDLHELVQELMLDKVEPDVLADLTITNKFLMRVHDTAVASIMSQKPISTIY